MQLQSSKFSDQQMIPILFTCKGNNTSPPLAILDVPKEAVSLALVVHDPDSPSRDFTHWLMWDIPANTKEILENQAPPGAVQGVNDFGNQSYGGPCPHQGAHRYVFSLFALDTWLNLPAQTSRSDLLKNLKEHTLDTSELTGLFSADNH